MQGTRSSQVTPPRLFMLPCVPRHSSTSTAGRSSSCCTSAASCHSTQRWKRPEGRTSGTTQTGSRPCSSRQLDSGDVLGALDPESVWGDNELAATTSQRSSVSRHSARQSRAEVMRLSAPSLWSCTRSLASGGPISPAVFPQSQHRNNTTITNTCGPHCANFRLPVWHVRCIEEALSDPSWTKGGASPSQGDLESFDRHSLWRSRLSRRGWCPSMARGTQQDIDSLISIAE